MINRTIPPEFNAIEEITLIHAKPHVLPNGLSIYQISKPDQDLVRIEFIFKNTGWDANRPLQSSAANAMLNDGTSELTSAQIAEKIDYYGAFLQTEHTLDYSSISLYTLNKHLAATLPVVQAILSDSVFPETELGIYAHNQKQKLGVSLQKNDIIARRMFNHALFGDTLYGYMVKPEDYDRLTRGDVLDYYKLAYQPANCTIVVSGRVTDHTLKLLDDTAGAWTRSNDGTAVANQFTFTDNTGNVHFWEKKDALQSAIRMGRVTINRKHPDFPGLQVLNTVLGGYFGSRLMANIREDKGYTYGIGSAVISLENAGYLFIASEVGADVCKAALAEIEKEISILKNEPVPAEELALVKNYLLGSLLGSLENAFSHADKFKNIHFYGLGYEYYNRYMQTIKSITPEQLLELAQNYLDTEIFQKVIAGRM